MQRKLNKKKGENLNKNEISKRKKKGRRCYVAWMNELQNNWRIKEN